MFIKQSLPNVFSSSVWALGSPLFPVTLWSEKEKQTLRSHPSHVGKHFNNQLSLDSKKVFCFFKSLHVEFVRKDRVVVLVKSVRLYLLTVVLLLQRCLQSSSVNAEIS